MPDPGGGPGRDPPDDSGPCEEEVEDLSVGPGPDVTVEEHRQKIINRLMEIGAAEERLKAVRAEHKAFRAKYCQAYSKHRTALRPELSELEDKVKKQTLFLEKLKERSGAFKEKFDNEQRFASQLDSSASSADRPSDDPAPSASAPLPPRQDWGSPAATSQGVEHEHGALRFIHQMESPLRADRFAFTDDPAEVPEDGRRRFRPVKQVLVEKSQYTKMACNMSAPTTPEDMISAGEGMEKELCKQKSEGNKEKLQKEPLAEETLDVQQIETRVPTACTLTKMDAARKVSLSAVPAGGVIGSAAGGGGAEQSAHRQCGISGDMQAACVTASSLQVTAGDTRENPQKSALLEKEISAGHESLGTTAVSMNTGKTSETLCVPADNADKTKALHVGGGNEGVNRNSKARQTDPQPVQSVSAKRNTGTYADVLGNRKVAGNVSGVNNHNALKFGGGLVGGFSRRNVVQLKFEGEGTPPVRERVVKLILEMGFRAADVFALICPMGSNEYDLSFMKPEGLDLFWERHEKCKGLSQWGGLVPKVISRQPLVKSVTILVRNESIPEADLTVWLRRYGEVLTPLRKTLDEHGIWTGAWTVSLKLRVLGNVVQHLPSSAFLGRDRLTIFYQGQPRVCNKCGEKGHYALSCTLKKCSLCQGIGHLARECTQIRCNLCQQLGHPYSQCPEALHNLPGLETELRRLDKEDEAADVREDADVAPPSVSVESESVNVPPSNVAPESVPPVVSSIVKAHRSSRLAEAAGGAGLADLPPRLVSPPVPLPRLRKRGQRSVEGLGRDGVDGVEGGVSISHVSPSPEVDSADQGWERGKKKKKKRRVNKVISSDPDSDIGDIPLGNRYAVLSGDEMLSDPSISLSSMDEGESRCLKRAVSGDESVVEVKKRLPQSS